MNPIRRDLSPIFHTGCLTERVDKSPSAPAIWRKDKKLNSVQLGQSLRNFGEKRTLLIAIIDEGTNCTTYDILGGMRFVLCSEYPFEREPKQIPNLLFAEHASCDHTNDP